MSRPLRVWALCAGAAALVAVAVSLTAYASATPPPRRAAAPAATSRLTPRTAPPTPVPTPAPIPRNKPVALVAGQPISGAAYADLVAQERVAAATQAQQQGVPAPDERRIRAQALTDIIATAVINHYARQHGIAATAREVQRQYDAT